MKTPTLLDERFYQFVLVVVGHLAFLSTKLLKNVSYQANIIVTPVTKHIIVSPDIALTVVLAITIYDLRLYM